jgi:hypothetical protein
MDIEPFNFILNLYFKRDYSLRPSSLRYEGQARDPKEGGFKTKKSLLLRLQIGWPHIMKHASIDFITTIPLKLNLK